MGDSVFEWLHETRSGRVVLLLIVLGCLGVAISVGVSEGLGSAIGAFFGSLIFAYTILYGFLAFIAVGMFTYGLWKIASGGPVPWWTLALTVVGGIVVAIIVLVFLSDGSTREQYKDVYEGIAKKRADGSFHIRVKKK